MNKRNFERNTPAKRGAAAVEFAVVAPIFFAVVLGIIEFGWAFMVGQLVTNSARDGARMAVVDGSTTSEVKAHVKTILNGSTGVAKSKFTVKVRVNGATSTDLTSAVSGDECQVEVKVLFSDVDLIPGTFLKSSYLQNKVTMRHE